MTIKITIDAQEVEGAGDVEVRDVDVPAFMGLKRLDKALALLQVEHVGAVLEDGCLSAIDLAGLESVLVTQF